MDLTRDELLRRLRIGPDELDDWVRHELLAPLPGDLFPASAVEDGEAIRKFTSLGYAIADIRTIKKSVGLPARDEAGRPVARPGDLLTIGELAERSGINVRTVKFWEEKGLIAPRRRTGGGFRLYRPSDVVLIGFIRDLQAFNYSLAEIGPILRLAGPDLGATDADLLAMAPGDLEKTGSSLEFLVERMREVREASVRVEGVFARRLRAVARIARGRRKSVPGS